MLDVCPRNEKKKALPMPQTPPSVPASTRRSWPPRLGARRVGSVPPSMRKVPSLAIRGKGVLCPIRVAWGSLPRGPPTRPAARPDRPMRVASPRASVLLSLVNRGPRLLAPSPRGITRGRAVVVTPVSLEATGLLPWCGEGEGGPCARPSASVPRLPEGRRGPRTGGGTVWRWWAPGSHTSSPRSRGSCPPRTAPPARPRYRRSRGADMPLRVHACVSLVLVPSMEGRLVLLHAAAFPRLGIIGDLPLHGARVFRVWRD